MAKPTKEQKELWCRFACAALAGYEAHCDPQDDDELADDMATVASKAADAMLDEYEERYAAGPRRKVKKAEPEPDPDDDDEEEEEEDDEE